MKSFSTVRVTQRGSQRYMEKRSGRRELEVTQMRWGGINSPTMFWSPLVPGSAFCAWGRPVAYQGWSLGVCVGMSHLGILSKRHQEVSGGWSLLSPLKTLRKGVECPLESRSRHTPCDLVISLLSQNWFWNCTVQEVFGWKRTANCSSPYSARACYTVDVRLWDFKWNKIYVHRLVNI